MFCPNSENPRRIAMTRSMHDRHADHGQPSQEPSDVASQGGHQDHGAHDEQSASGGSINAMAASATLHCLTGCAIGEIAGLIIGTAMGLTNVATIALAIGLAFLFGYSLSTLPLVKRGSDSSLPWASSSPPTRCQSPPWRSSTTRSWRPFRARWTRG